MCTGTGDIQCTDGTILVDDHCEIDPTSCQDGTVLMGDKCVDPATQTATIEEAAEPNGLGLGGELSNTVAGEIALKPVGEHFTIHGTIKPFQDADGDGQLDADFDSYVLEVTAPTLISVSADGLHGLAGGFVAVANAGSTDPLADWTRFGVNPTGDTAKRQIYLPAAGVYIIAIADSRSLFLTGAAPGAESGQLDFEYYVTVDQLTATPTTLTVTDGVASSQGQLSPGEVKLFSVEMGEGLNNAELAVAIDQVAESLVVANTRSSATTVKAVGDGDSGDGAAAAAQVLGLRTGDSQVVAVDSVFDYANAPYDYDLTVTLGSAGALSTTGGDVAQPSDEVDLSVFFYDVAAGQLLTGMDLAFDRPVAGVLVDEDFYIFSNFTYTPGLGFDGSFESYLGLLNHATAGRYYFLVYDPDGDLTDITATSSYAAVTPVAITKGTELSDQAINAFNSSVFTYAAGVTDDPWQQFSASGTDTYLFQVSYYKPGDVIGRLDYLEVPDCSYCFSDDSPLPAFDMIYDDDGDTYGRILLDDNTPTYFVKVNTYDGTGSFSLKNEPRPFTDLGTAAVGAPIASADQALDDTVTIQRYLVRTAADNRLITTVHPHDTVAIDPAIEPLEADESTRGHVVDDGGDGDDEEWTSIQTGNGWTAFTVTAATPVAGGAFDLSVEALPPRYTKTAGTTAYADACAGGTSVALDDDDEGQSATIAAPAGFELFGTAVTDFSVFSNGFISFDTALTCGVTCFYSNQSIPSAGNPNGIVAPYWDDIYQVSVCTKTDGNKLVIQWTGALYSTDEPVAFQAILDGSNSSVEFVYSSAHVPTGASATIGLEDLTGAEAATLGVNTAGSATGTLLTP